MFTGLVQETGTLAARSGQADIVFTIRAPGLASRLAPGASVACDGICLTVLDSTGDSFRVQAGPETLAVTLARNWEAGRPIHLEPALRAGDELGGHIVSGHVDGLARLVERRPEGDSLFLRFEAAPALTRFLAPKGSVALNGVSLTINSVEEPCFAVTLIPHTLRVTTLGALKAGDAVNLEVDSLARYVVHYLETRGAM